MSKTLLAGHWTDYEVTLDYKMKFISIHLNTHTSNHLHTHTHAIKKTDNILTFKGASMAFKG